MDSSAYPVSCGWAISFDDMVADEFESNDCLSVENAELMILSPWSMCYTGSSAAALSGFQGSFLPFWRYRGQSFFMSEADSYISMCGVASNLEDFPEGVRLTNLEILHFIRAECGVIEIPSPAGLALEASPPDSPQPELAQPEPILIVRDLIIATTVQGAQFGFYTDNASRLGRRPAAA